MDRLFEDRWVSPGSYLTWSGLGMNYLPLDVYETADELVVRAVVAGVEPEAIDIQFQAGVLTLRARAEEPAIPDGAAWLVHEVTPGEYIRQVTLPRTIDADKAETTFENGVLTLTLPKTADAKPKQIKVGADRQIGAASTQTEPPTWTTATACTPSPSRPASAACIPRPSQVRAIRPPHAASTSRQSASLLAGRPAPAPADPIPRRRSRRKHRRIGAGLGHGRSARRSRIGFDSCADADSDRPGC